MLKPLGMPAQNTVKVRAGRRHTAGQGRGGTPDRTHTHTAQWRGSSCMQLRSDIILQLRPPWEGLPLRYQDRQREFSSTSLFPFLRYQDRQGEFSSTSLFPSCVTRTGKGSSAQPASSPSCVTRTGKGSSAQPASSPFLRYQDRQGEFSTTSLFPSCHCPHPIQHIPLTQGSTYTTSHSLIPEFRSTASPPLPACQHIPHSSIPAPTPSSLPSSLFRGSSALPFPVCQPDPSIHHSTPC